MKGGLHALPAPPSRIRLRRFLSPALHLIHPGRERHKSPLMREEMAWQAEVKLHREQGSLAPPPPPCPHPWGGGGGNGRSVVILHSASRILRNHIKANFFVCRSGGKRRQREGISKRQSEKRRSEGRCNTRRRVKERGDYRGIKGGRIYPFPCVACVFIRETGSLAGSTVLTFLKSQMF